MTLDAIDNALVRLDPQPRAFRWTSLSYCLLDATWSISARYDAVVAPLVHRVARDNGDEHPLMPADQPIPADPLPLPNLLKHYPDEAALMACANAQRTSTRGGITKADAVLRQARILTDHGIIDLITAQRAQGGHHDEWDLLNRELAKVPGEGQDGIRRGYLWMLCGDDNGVKPDRMVIRWLARHGQRADADAARELLERAAARLTQRLRRPVTPWMLDHAIWLDERPSPIDPTGRPGRHSDPRE